MHSLCNGAFLFLSAFVITSFGKWKLIRIFNEKIIFYMILARPVALNTDNTNESIASKIEMGILTD